MHLSKRPVSLLVTGLALLAARSARAQSADVDATDFANTRRVDGGPHEPPPPAPRTTAPAADPDTYTLDDPSGAVLPYQEGSAIPNGYRLRGSPRYGLVGGGIALTSALWTISTAAAIVLDEEDSPDGDPNFDDMYWPMFIPVVGPFIAIKTADASGTGAAILALDGVVQTAGLAMLIAGLAAPKLELVPQQKIHIAPRVSAGSLSLELGGTF